MILTGTARAGNALKTTHGGKYVFLHRQACITITRKTEEREHHR